MKVQMKVKMKVLIKEINKIKVMVSDVVIHLTGVISQEFNKS
jgi:hypothetical protein